MTIISLEFRDKLRDWQLNRAVFSNFNLLVGLSGVGKTRILSSLGQVCDVGLDRAYANGCQWTLELRVENDTYVWQAETSVVREARHERDTNDLRPSGDELPRFLQERISVNKETLVARDENQFTFQNTRLPKLKNTESAISLLSDEESIQPLYRALSRVTFFDEDVGYTALPFAPSKLDVARRRYADVDELCRATDISLLLKAYFIQEDYPDVFEKIKEDYTNIFETVIDIKIDKLSKFDPLALQGAPPTAQDWLILAIKEEKVNDWITSPRLSAGMLRTLIHLLELAMTERGGVIVIDEFESSLGVNCLPQITEHFLMRSNELQFILTSHHPYVINNVPMQRWKVVTRNGSEVSVLNADEITALNTTSSQEQFLLLMNLKEYEEGIR